jgi:hypothetical protein
MAKLVIIHSGQGFFAVFREMVRQIFSHWTIDAMREFGLKSIDQNKPLNHALKGVAIKALLLPRLLRRG